MIMATKRKLLDNKVIIIKSNAKRAFYVNDNFFVTTAYLYIILQYRETTE